MTQRVATVLDGRAIGSGGLAAEIRLLDRRLPLVAIASVDLEPPASPVSAHNAVPIDPVLRRPVDAEPPRPHSLMDQSEYIKVLLGTGAARLGHIVRPAGRHYTAHVDPTALFRDPGWTAHVTDRTRMKIHLAHGELFRDDATDAPVCIMYPGATGDDLGRVAQQLQDVLRRSRTRVIGLVEVPRAARGTQWLFPPSVPVPPEARHLVFIDAVSGTGRTALQLIRLAAASHVELVTGVILLNGLSDLDALAPKPRS